MKNLDPMKIIADSMTPDKMQELQMQIDLENIEKENIFTEEDLEYEN